MGIFKKLFVPKGEKQELTAYETWSVRWYSRYGGFSGDTKPEMELFTNKEDADKFAEELRAAYKLIRHTSGTQVKVSKNE